MLAKRDLDILQQVVDIYVREGVPVSSGRVKDLAGLPVSSATIRNTMVRLEERGCLSKPHTSAGRVPTDEGYRAYVDHLDCDVRFGEVFSSRLRREIRDRSADAESIMVSASKILGDLSKNFALVYGSVLHESRISNIRLVELDRQRVLVDVNVIPENENTVVLRFDREFGSDAVHRAERRINDLLTGKTMSDARECVDAMVRDNISDEGIILREIAVHRGEVFPEARSMQLYFEESGHLMDQPELSDPKLLQLLLGLLQNKTYLAQVLSDRDADDTCITIGREHADRQLQPFSLVTAGYRMGAANGVLGIIGPTRMRYDQIYALVDCAARTMRAIGEEYL